jgi:hypothetical protein
MTELWLWTIDGGSGDSAFYQLPLDIQAVTAVTLMGLPTVYQAGFLAAEGGLKAATDLSMPEAAKADRRAATRRPRRI